ncbi:MAG TPA: LysM peptidoglycan-binding domain-containing M23 family metallopeptidase [Acidimicrobiales bacterium]|nr:LysM peptidoglycan-binding domain-containing M23 family metallopeptidase [Acidimicrobiales bacterium]
MRVPLRPRDICALAAVGVFALAASGTHVIRNGETLSGIASSHGTTVGALVEANGLADPDLIIAGQELTIPGGGSAGSGSGGSSTSTYTVRAGDTLATIAARHGTTVRALAAANGITDPNLIVIGRDLKVLAASGGGSSAPRPISTSGGSGKQLPGQRHTVQPGDTIAGIAARYGLSSQDLIAWNGLVDGRIYATTRLVLFNPGGLPGAGGSSGGGTHVVASGETLASIASRHGVRSSAIASANGITDPNRIRVGQKLTIPGSSGGGGGGIVCPVAGASFFNDWGFPRSGGRSHAGTDLFAPRGTPVRAPASGRLDTAVGTIGGKQFRLTASDGTLWFGSHMDAFGATGQVSAGDVIGYVGDSGNARGSRPHLHFEVHPGGVNAVNPYPLRRSSC